MQGGGGGGLVGLVGERVSRLDLWGIRVSARGVACRAIRKNEGSEKGWVGQVKKGGRGVSGVWVEGTSGGFAGERG